MGSDTRPPMMTTNWVDLGRDCSHEVRGKSEAEAELAKCGVSQ